MHAARWAHFRRRMSARTVVYAILAGAGLGVAAVGAYGNALYLPGGVALVLAATAIYHWTQAGGESEREFFASLAPRLGLAYLVSGGLPPITPLLSAGNSRRCTNVMEGPLFGALGGPLCTLAHYEFRTVNEDGRQMPAVPFTVCAMEIDAALPVFHGVYLRRRPGFGLGLAVHDWLDRAPRPEPVDLESTDFEELYELLVARDQDRLVLHQLFSPSFIVWLSEHPLRPGFECKAGMLTVFIPEHEGNADHLTLFHEAAREIARRVIAAVESARPAVTQAG